MSAEIRLSWTPSQADFDAFAALSGDDNPIHVDPAFSARTRFGRTVAHGMLLYTRVWGALREAWPEAARCRRTLMFPNPSFAGEALTLELTRHGDTVAVMVRRAAGGEICLSGEASLRSPTGKNASPSPVETALSLPDEEATGGSKLAIGRTASLSRRFSASDAASFQMLSGLGAPPGGVPEPLIGALFSTLLGVRLPGAGTNYLKQEMEFLRAPAWNELLTAEVRVTRLRPEKSLADLATTCRGDGDQVFCRGRALVLVRDVG